MPQEKWQKCPKVAQDFPNGPGWPKWPKVPQKGPNAKNSETNFVWGRPVLHWSTKQLVFHSALVDQFLQQFSGRTNYLPAEGRQLSILPILIISIIIRIFLIIIIIIIKTMMEKILAGRECTKKMTGEAPEVRSDKRNPG